MKNWDLAIIHRETISSIIIKKRKVKFSRQANHVGERSAKLNHKGYLSSASQFFITVYSHHCTWWELVEVRFLFLSYLSLHSQFWLSASHCCCPVQEKGKHGIPFLVEEAFGWCAECSLGRRQHSRGADGGPGDAERLRPPGSGTETAD